MKELKHYLHFYLGSQVRVFNNVTKEFGNWRELTIVTLNLAVNNNAIIDLQLRKISEMTDEERKHIYHLLLDHTDRIGFDLLKDDNEYFGTLPTNFEVYKYLLGKGFDCFNLIESNLVTHLNTQLNDPQKNQTRLY